MSRLADLAELDAAICEHLATSGTSPADSRLIQDIARVAFRGADEPSGWVSRADAAEHIVVRVALLVSLGRVRRVMVPGKGWRLLPVDQVQGASMQAFTERERDPG